MREVIVQNETEADEAKIRAHDDGLRLSAISNTGLSAGKKRLTFLPKEVFGSDNDKCHCGDRRSDHVDGQGACRLNGLGHGMGSSSAGECHQFRFASQ